MFSALYFIHSIFCRAWKLVSSLSSLRLWPPEFSDFIRCHPISRPLVPLANFREPPSNSPFKITLWITFNKFRNLNRPQQIWKQQLLNSPFHIYTLTYMNHGQHIRRSQDYNFNPPLQTSNDIFFTNNPLLWPPHPLSTAPCFGKCHVYMDNNKV